MSINALPPEIIIIILKKLNGTEIAKCRRVCRRWCSIICAFPDHVWENCCCRDFCSPLSHDIWSPQLARRHANLNYCELYKSLALWDRVEKADTAWWELPVADERHVLEGYNIFNDQLSVLRSFTPKDDGETSTFIDYYNLVSLELISTQHYSFPSWKYYENEKLYALFDYSYRVHIIIKSNQEEKVYDVYFTELYMLSEDTLYFINMNLTVCVARPKIVDEEETIEITELAQILVNEDDHDDNEILAYAPADAGPNAVNILLVVGDFVRICCVHDNICDEIEVDLTTPNIIAKLKEFGFNLTDPDIYCSIHDLTKENKTAQLNVVRCVDLSAVRFHNEVLLMGTDHGDIRVYKRAYSQNGELNISHDGKPDRTITIGDFTENSVFKIDVIEIKNRHRIIVSIYKPYHYSKKVYFIDLI